LLEEAQWHRSWIITTDRRLRERDGRRHECRDRQKTREDETKSYEINLQISLSLSLKPQISKAFLIRIFSRNAESLSPSAAYSTKKLLHR
jgi:hypothetical protein